jgi:glutaredoxin 1
MSFIVYGKESCPHCVSAVELLKANDIAFTYKKMEVDYTKEELLDILAPFNVIPRTVPQIVFDNDGELEAHQAWLKCKQEVALEFAAEQTDPRVAKALIDRYENYVAQEKEVDK